MLINQKGKYYRDSIEITAEEYSAALAETKAKADWVDKICAGFSFIEDVPTQWQEEIIQRVDYRKAQADDDPELTAEETLCIIVGGAQ